MTRDRLKLLAIAALLLPLMAIVLFTNAPVKAGASLAADDAAATFKAKCAMCHSPKAEKFYDPAKPEEEQIQAVLKGKKGEKPPYMPGFEAKGMTAEEAKALVEYMKSLKTQ
jgi:mono/diheme cytochrome c family protein